MYAYFLEQLAGIMNMHTMNSYCMHMHTTWCTLEYIMHIYTMHTTVGVSSSQYQSRCTYQLVQQLRGVCSYSPVTSVAVSIGAMATNTSLPTTSVLPITFKYSIYQARWDMLLSSKGREKINLQINSDYELLFTYLQPLEKVNSLRPQSLVISQW